MGDCETTVGMETTAPQLWQTSLQESSNKMAIFKDDTHKKVSLSEKVLKLEPPSSASAITTEVEERCELQSGDNDDIIYSQTIASTGTVSATYAFVGMVRMRASVNPAVQKNVSQFL